MARRYVFLDPDGSVELGLHVIVRAPTRVVYAHQCGGLATDLREAEGYLVPLGDAAAAAPLVSFFAERFRGNPPLGAAPSDPWTDEDLARVRALVADVRYWHTEPDGADDRPGPLVLDDARLDEATEAWLPVLTADGPGVLVFANCD